MLKQDERYKNVPLLIDVFKTIDFRNINRENAHKIKDTVLFYIKSDKETNFLDVVETQIYIISEELKDILQKYEKDILFKSIILINLKEEVQENYCLPIFEEIEALSPKSEFNLDKSIIKKLILDKEKIKGRKIFKIKEGSKTQIVVRLDVAESILRRDFTGLRLERIEIE